MKQICQHCAYIWSTTSEMKYITCPNCIRKTLRNPIMDNIEIDEEELGKLFLQIKDEMSPDQVRWAYVNIKTGSLSLSASLTGSTSPNPVNWYPQTDDFIFRFSKWSEWEAFPSDDEITRCGFENEAEFWEYYNKEPHIFAQEYLQHEIKLLEDIFYN